MCPDQLRNLRRLSSRDMLRRVIAQRRLRVEPFGLALRIHGHGVDILARSLDDVSPMDLVPVDQKRQHR